MRLLSDYRRARQISKHLMHMNWFEELVLQSTILSFQPNSGNTALCNLALNNCCYDVGSTAVVNVMVHNNRLYAHAEYRDSRDLTAEGQSSVLTCEFPCCSRCTLGVSWKVNWWHWVRKTRAGPGASEAVYWLLKSHLHYEVTNSRTGPRQAGILSIFRSGQFYKCRILRM